jgi:pyrroloquinoline-quinone synthase
MPVAPDQLLAELTQIVEGQHYQRHPFVTDLEAGKFSRENLRRWAIQKYLQLNQHIRAFGGIYLNCPDPEVRRFVVENLIDEETSLSGGSDTHANLMLRFARALGATDEEVAAAEMIPEVKQYVDWVIEMARSAPYVVSLAALAIGGESQNPSAMRRMMQALQTRYGIASHDLEFFAAHIGGDEKHSGIAERVVREHATTDELQARVREAVADFCRHWWQMQDGYYRVAADRETAVA